MLTPQTPPTSEWHLTETYKGLITLSIEGLKILALINGGAAVAVLTYLGNLASRSPVPAHIPEIKPALYSYCGGLLATVLTFLVAYLTQLRLYYEERDLRGGVTITRRHAVGIAIGCVLSFGGAFAFGLGCWFAATALAP